MSGGVQRARGSAIELVHHLGAGDGAAALEALLADFDGRNRSPIEDTYYDNHRLRVKSRILQQDPPDTWTGWPGGELERYVEAGTVADTTAVWRETDIENAFIDVAADASTVDGTYYGVPLGLHRINDLYVHVGAAEEAAIDPADADSPSDLLDVLSTAATALERDEFLLPMADPFTVLQLWEVILLGEFGYGPFRAITGGDAASHRDAIREALELLVSFAAYAPEDALYRTLTDANEAFVDGVAPLYNQGDWAGGVFVDAADFAYGTDWKRIPFPGTESMYVVVMDTVVPSARSEHGGLRDFLEHVGSTAAQEAFNRRKGSLPVRTDVAVDAFNDFARDGKAALDRSVEQPKSITHGLAVTPAQLVDLKATVAEFVDDWDVDRATAAIVDVFDDASSHNC